MTELNVKNYFKFMEEVEKFFYEQLSQPTAKHYKQIAHMTRGRFDRHAHQPVIC